MDACGRYPHGVGELPETVGSHNRQGHLESLLDQGHVKVEFFGFAGFGLKNGVKWDVAGDGARLEHVEILVFISPFRIHGHPIIGLHIFDHV